MPASDGRQDRDVVRTHGQRLGDAALGVEVVRRRRAVPRERVDTVLEHERRCPQSGSLEHAAVGVDIAAGHEHQRDFAVGERRLPGGEPVGDHRAEPAARTPVHEQHISTAVVREALLDAVEIRQRKVVELLAHVDPGRRLVPGKLCVPVDVRRRIADTLEQSRVAERPGEPEHVGLDDVTIDAELLAEVGDQLVECRLAVEARPDQRARGIEDGGERRPRHQDELVAHRDLLRLDTARDERPVDLLRRLEVRRVHVELLATARAYAARSTSSLTDRSTSRGGVLPSGERDADRTVAADVACRAAAGACPLCGDRHTSQRCHARTRTTASCRVGVGSSTTAATANGAAAATTTARAEVSPRIRPTGATGGAGHGRSVPATCTLAGRITALRCRRAPAGATVGRRRPGRTRPASCGRGGTGTATTAGGHNRRGRRVRRDERTRSASTPSAAIQPVGAVTAGAPCSESAHATVARRSVSESASTACSTRKPAQGVVASLRCDRAGQTASCTTCGPRILDHRAARAAAAAGTDDGEGDRATSWNDDVSRPGAGTDRGSAGQFGVPWPRGFRRGFR